MLATRSAVVPMLLALALARVQGQEAVTDPNQALQELLSKALTISISARVWPPDADADAAVWNAESTRLTIPGRSIRVRVDADNVRIYLICTPYVQDNGEVLLLAQGQVWYSEPTDNESRYSGTYYAIPMSFGTPVFFYPLGVSETGTTQKGYFNIELEIKIVPYEANASSGGSSGGSGGGAAASKQ
jgi:hypothetical protein